MVEPSCSIRGVRGTTFWPVYRWSPIGVLVTDHSVLFHRTAATRYVKSCSEKSQLRALFVSFMKYATGEPSRFGTIALLTVRAITQMDTPFASRSSG